MPRRDLHRTHPTLLLAVAEVTAAQEGVFDANGKTEKIAAEVTTPDHDETVEREPTRAEKTEPARIVEEPSEKKILPASGTNEGRSAKAEEPTGDKAADEPVSEEQRGSAVGKPLGSRDEAEGEDEPRAKGQDEAKGKGVGSGAGNGEAEGNSKSKANGKGKAGGNGKAEERAEDGAGDGERRQKVTLCHKGKKTLSVGAPAEAAHLWHGDTQGPCE